jgi:hypothetical protein
MKSITTMIKNMKIVFGRQFRFTSKQLTIARAAKGKANTEQSTIEANVIMKS